jgi:hypothetical protein
MLLAPQAPFPLAWVPTLGATSTWLSSLGRLSMMTVSWYCTIAVVLAFANRVLQGWVKQIEVPQQFDAFGEVGWYPVTPHNYAHFDLLPTNRMVMLWILIIQSYAVMSKFPLLLPSFLPIPTWKYTS